MSSDTLPLHIVSPPEPVDPELEPLLADPFASALAADDAGRHARSGALRGRLMERLDASRAAEAAMVTVRHRRLQDVPVAPGVSARRLYAAPQDRPLRPGEPLRARLVRMAPGGRWDGPDAVAHREWLVLRGALRVGGTWLTPRDYHVMPAGTDGGTLEASDEGALVFLRESTVAAADGDAPATVRDAEAGWPEYAPGIRRRVLWQRDGEAAMLYLAQPKALVPHHTHGHDEECLMVQGELFLDDVLLQEGDYQLAPAGTGHRLTETDTGVVIYAHGDLDLRFVG